MMMMAVIQFIQSNMHHYSSEWWWWCYLCIWGWYNAETLDHDHLQIQTSYQTTTTQIKYGQVLAATSLLQLLLCTVTTRPRVSRVPLEFHCVTWRHADGDVTWRKPTKWDCLPRMIQITICRGLIRKSHFWEINCWFMLNHALIPHIIESYMT